MKKIIYTRLDGGLSIVTPNRNTHPVPENLTDKEILDRSMKDVPKDAIGVQIVDESDIPTDRTFRNAWVAGSGKVEHDMHKAREIQKDKLRSLRKPELEKLDVDFMMALEKGTSTKEISEKKQALRDVTANPAISNAKTPDELKAISLDIIKRS